MKILKKVKEIVSLKGELHFERWAIFECKKTALYFHRIHKADRDHLHSHPHSFISLILKGSYLEEITKNQKTLTYNWKRPLVCAYTNKIWFHKIKEILFGPVYTLVFVWGGNFEGDQWGYLVNNQSIPFEKYRQIKTKAKENNKSIEEYLYYGKNS